MYNYYAMLKSHVTHPHCRGASVVSTLIPVLGSIRSAVAGLSIFLNFFFFFFPFYTSNVERCPFYIFIYLLFLFFYATWIILFMVVYIPSGRPRSWQRHCKYTRLNVEKENRSRAQGERHSPNYKRKFVFKCKKIITHKCSFYTI